MKIFAKENGMRKEDEEEGKEVSILKRGGPLIAKKSGWEAEKLLSYFEMPDGTLVFDLAKLPEIIESYAHYFR